MSVIEQIVRNANCLHRIAKINYYNYRNKNLDVIDIKFLTGATKHLKWGSKQRFLCLKVVVILQLGFHQKMWGRAIKEIRPLFQEPPSDNFILIFQWLTAATASIKSFINALWQDCNKRKLMNLLHEENELEKRGSGNPYHSNIGRLFSEKLILPIPDFSVAAAIL